jgi:chromosome segregation ATPase
MNSVIKPWLSAGLIVALAGNVILTAILILKLSRFDDMKRQAEEVEVLATQKRTELAGLKVEVESLTKQKDSLAPTVTDWEKRLKEKTMAEAALATLEAKQRQTDSDVTQAGKRLEEVLRSLADAQKQKADTVAAFESLSSELASLTRTNVDVKALLNLASEAQRRRSEATNSLANAETRRRQLEADANTAQAKFDQLQKETDDLRQSREKLNTETASLRQQIQSLKEQLAPFDQKAADLKALQATAQQEEQKLTKAQQQLATVETRTTEMEARHQKAASELAQLTNRMDQARALTADWEVKRDTALQAATQAGQDLAAVQKLAAEAQAVYDQTSREQTKAAAQLASLKKELEQARKDQADLQARLDVAKVALDKAEGETTAARRLSQEFSTKQGELTREAARLESSVEKLKKEREVIEKEIGGLESQRQKAPTGGTQ